MIDLLVFWLEEIEPAYRRVFAKDRKIYDLRKASVRNIIKQLSLLTLELSLTFCWCREII